MKIALTMTAALLLLTAGVAAAQPAEIHVPVPAGWTAVDQEYRYGRDNLWEYINGAADLFLEYSFRELIVLDLEQGDWGLSVSVYDMARRLDAFGVYEAEKPADAANVDGVGAGAVLQPPYRGLLLKDRFYVKVEVGGGDLPADVLEAAMRDIAAGLPGTDELPAALVALPDQGRKTGTVAFTGANYLGLDILRNCLHADYEIDGRECQLFVMPPSEAFLRNEDGRWSEAAGENGERIFIREIPYSGAVVLMGNDEQLLGVSGFEDAAAAIDLLISVRGG